MIYQPRNVNPSNTSVDGSLDNTFSMEVQTNTYVSAYQLYILDFDNNQIYTGSKTNLTTNAYNGDVIDIPVDASTVALSNGTNYKWHVRLYQPTADMLITYGIVQQTGTATEIYTQPNINIRAGMTITINSQTQTIASYDVDTGIATVSTGFSTVPQKEDQYKIYSDFIETVPDFIVYARQTPTVSISNIPSPLTLKYNTFTGVYTQSDNVPIVYHQFDLYMQNADGTRTLVDSSGRVYSANLTYTYDGFRTGNTYIIQMTVENNMGVTVTTEEYSFVVDYDIVEYLQQPQATFDNTQNAVRISWAAPTENEATSSSGSFDFLYNTPYRGSNSLYTNGYTATWESEDGLCEMPDDYNITFQFSPDNEFFYDENGNFVSEKVMIVGETDDESGVGSFEISINGSNLVFTQEPDISFTVPFYTGVTSSFVLTETGNSSLNNDYIWMDTETWNDSYIWTEGGTALERICNHWWKVQITNSGIKIEEFYPTT